MMQQKTRDWTEDSRFENGNYFCRCLHCEEQFIGHKRRVVCKQCASDPLTEDSVIETSLPALQQNGSQDHSVRQSEG